ncbi:hypothetical protein BDM02DRAFT_3109004 [Thelephora ganbajun]|uniref:Uncharacterized protein n=1 Tax=Thelephora ganbajun TaxID=370292 RepID=A0ACB6ZSG3_THEGA|nr:hypothetical protein BDM02DRAFT_3109004 [Thelephora ganbajun]
MTRVPNSDRGRVCPNEAYRAPSRFNGSLVCTVLQYCHVQSLFAILTPHARRDQVLDCSYPPSFLSNSGNEFFACLPLLSLNVFLNCVRRFRGSISKGYQTKADYTNLIQNDFVRQVNQPMWLFALDLQRVGVSARWLLIKTSIAAGLSAYSGAEDGISQPAWSQAPVAQLEPCVLQLMLK